MYIRNNHVLALFEIINNDKCVLAVCVQLHPCMYTSPCSFMQQYRITRMFCEHQTYAHFARVDQFATYNKIATPTSKINMILAQIAIVRSQRVTFSADLAHSRRFFTSKVLIIL